MQDVIFVVAKTTYSQLGEVNGMMQKIGCARNAGGKTPKPRPACKLTGAGAKLPTRKELDVSNLNMNPVTMQTQLGTERPVQVDDAVQSLRTKRAYAVVSIDPETGKPTLYRKGHRRIYNADPRKYRILERPATGQTMEELRTEVARG